MLNNAMGHDFFKSRHVPMHGGADDLGHIFLGNLEGRRIERLSIKGIKCQRGIDKCATVFRGEDVVEDQGTTGTGGA